MQDAAGRTAVHHAIEASDETALAVLLEHPSTAALTLRDSTGATPLGVALRLDDARAAALICRRLPSAALIVDARGQNLLHAAIRSDNFEGVLFMLGLQVSGVMFSSQQLHPSDRCQRACRRRATTIASTSGR